MKIQKITSTNFQNNVKGNFARRLLYSTATATALLVSAPKINAQTFTDQYGQTYVHYPQYQLKLRGKENAMQQEQSAQSQTDAARHEMFEAERELSKLRREINRASTKYQDELKFKNNFNQDVNDLVITYKDTEKYEQEWYLRAVNDYNNYVKQHKASPWIGFGVGSLLGLLGFAAFNRKSKK